MGETYSDHQFWEKKVAISYFLAILVFLIHNSAYSQYAYDEGIVSSLCIFLKRLMPAIGCVAVPLFMIISGALFFRNYQYGIYISKLKRRVHTLLVPYIIWNTISMFFSILVFAFFAKYIVGRIPFEFSFINVLKSVFCYAENGPFWFMADLMIYVALSPILYFFMKNKIIGYVFLVVLALAYSNRVLPDSILYDSSSLFFFFFGGEIGVHYSKGIKKKSILPNNISLLTILSAVVFYFIFHHYREYFGFVSTTGMNCMYLFCRLSYCVALWSIFDVIMPVIVPLKCYWYHSFWVYALHVNVSAIVIKLLLIILPMHPIFAIINHFLSTIISLVVISLIAQLIKNISVPLYNVLSGSR